MSRTLTILFPLGAALITACDSGGDAARSPAVDGAANTEYRSARASQNDAAVPERADTSLPPAAANRRYVGTWAETVSGCASAAWTFQARHLETADGTSCDFDDVVDAPGGYDVQATCIGGKGADSGTLTLRFAESAQALLVDSDMVSSVGLIHCPAD
ncbi:hypothetical protein [Stakelama saccharophila]|uniref:Lipoprotein n=1 Tax=Stakelama saccharophila TaxID=3075605 RepID=A0ABZ0B531_9SPHN|nr:hypothetical protein [Stakelama sp. W311]WNO52483.1 hypothetical protein RPR59_08320 [Stakelama sp. W311]